MIKINHRKDCKANIRCKKCGRSICINCSHKGICVICMGEFKENEIELHPIRPWLDHKRGA